MVQKYLADKARQERTGGLEIGNTDYPITFKTPDDKLTGGYISDAKQEIIPADDDSDETFTLSVLIWNVDFTQMYEYQNRCIAPKGCHVDWNNVNCATPI